MIVHDLGLIELPIGSLEWNEHADRKDFKDDGDLLNYVAKLKTSIAVNGITKPPLAVWHLKQHNSSDGNKFMVKEGNHRLQAANELGIKKVLCQVHLYDYGEFTYMVDKIKWLLKRGDV